MSTEESGFTPAHVLVLRLLSRRRVLSGVGQKKFVESVLVVVRRFQKLRAGGPNLTEAAAGVLHDAVDAVVTLHRSRGHPEKLAVSAAILTDLAINAS